jgi:hypothetical protein
MGDVESSSGAVQRSSSAGGPASVRRGVLSASIIAWSAILMIYLGGKFAERRQWRVVEEVGVGSYRN